MRILFINFCYENYWRQLYAKFPGLENLTYHEQLKVLHDDCFLFYGVYPQHLLEYGYQCEEFFYDIRPQQETWAKENGIPWDDNNFKQINPLEKVRQFRPDMIFLVSMEHGPEWMDQARAVCPTLKYFVRWCAVPLPMHTLKGYDLVLTSARGIEQLMRDNGISVSRVPFAFNTRVLDAVGGDEEKVYPLSFVGSIHYSKGYHLDRTNILARLLQEKLLTPFAQVDSLTWKRKLYLKMTKRAWKYASHLGLSDEAIASFPLVGEHLAIGNDMNLDLLDTITRYSLGPRYGVEMYRAFSKSYATFNVHVDAAGEYVGNIRMYEATGIGTCLLTDWKRDLHEIFDIDTEVVAYRTPDEAIEKAKWLVDNPQKCIEIGLAAKKRVLRDHTYRNRAELMHQIFTAKLLK